MPIFVELLSVVLLALLAARIPSPPWRGRALSALKTWVTVRALWLLLTHAVPSDGGGGGAVTRQVLQTLGDVDAASFWTFCAVAAGVRFVGTLAAMFRWTLLLRGQSIELPFRHIFGSFLIGRFVGVLLPGSVGLDGYKLYDAARFSGKTVEVAVTTVVEKGIALAGVFLAFLVAVSFAFEEVAADALRAVAGLVPVALGVFGAAVFALWHPGCFEWLLRRLPLPGRGDPDGSVLRAVRSAAAYRHARDLVLAAFGLSLVAQLSTAAMLYFTLLALGAAGAELWSIALGASTETVAAVLAPLGGVGGAAGELTRAAALRDAVGPAQAAAAAFLGFWATEAFTLAGGFFWWMRPAGYHPPYCLVDGRQVDYPEARREAMSLGRAAAALLGRPQPHEPLAARPPGELLPPRVRKAAAPAGR